MFENYRKIIKDDMNVLNGIVNPILFCHSYSFDYIEESNNLAVSNPSTGMIIFNLIAISEYLGDMSVHDVLSFCIRMVAHELSHLDQEVDLNRYKNDMQYHSWIERTNESNTIDFLFKNIDFIKNKLGDYSYDIYKDAYMKIMQQGTGYVRSTIENKINMVGDRYILHDKYGRFNNYNSVSLCIHNTSNAADPGTMFILKNKSSFLSPNIIYPIVYEIDKYSRIGVENECNVPGELKIDVYIDDADRRIESVIFRIKNKERYSQDR